MYDLKKAKITLLHNLEENGDDRGSFLFFCYIN